MTLDSYQQPSVENACHSILKGKNVGVLPAVEFRPFRVILLVILVSTGRFVET